MPTPLDHPANRRRALLFELVNATSWSVVAGAPLIIHLKGLGASSTVIGIAIAMIPLMQALQLAGARLLPRTGYRGLMVRGWTVRTVMVGLMAVVAWLVPWTGATVAIWTTLALFTGWTVLRGITSCAWTPWLSHLVPEAERGRFLAWTMALIQGTLVVFNIAYAAWLGVVPGAVGCGALLAWSCASGLFAAWVMSRIPDAPVDGEGGAEPVPWREMLRHKPFTDLLRFDILYFVAMSACGVLWVPVLKDVYHQGDGWIALLPVWASLASLASLPLLGAIIDRTGSRPMLAMALSAMIVHTVLWGLFAAGFLPLSWATLAAIQFAGGLGGAAFAVANQRLLMAVVPGQGRSHFFALHSVAFALGLGIAPVLWGLAADGMVGWHRQVLGVELNGYAVLYLLAGVLLVMALVRALRLSEPRALSTPEFLNEMLVLTPGRALARLRSLIDR